MRKLRYLFLILVLIPLGLLAQDTWTVAGSSTALFGEEWNPAIEANDMTLDEESGLYTWTATDVMLSVGTVQFKIVKNHDWGVSYPSGDNSQFSINASGKYNVTITFDAETFMINASATRTDDAVATNVYTVTIMNIEHWDVVYAYTWTYHDGVTTQYAGAWPGIEIAKTGTKVVDDVEYDIYTYTLESEEAPEYIIFNNGGNGRQSADLPFVNGMQYEDLNPPVIVNLDATGCATLSSNYIVSFENVTNVKAYRASEVTNDGVVVMSQVMGNIPAKTGLFLVGEPNAQVYIPTSFVASSVGTNYLVPSITGGTITSSSEGKYHYVYKADEQYFQTGFFDVSENVNYEAGTAYIETTTPLTTDYAGMARWIYEEDYQKYGTAGGKFKFYVNRATVAMYGQQESSVGGILMTYGSEIPEGQEMTGQYNIFENIKTPLSAIEGFEIKYNRTYGTRGNEAYPKDDNMEDYDEKKQNVPTSGTFYTFEPTFDGSLVIGILLRTGASLYVTEEGTPLDDFSGVMLNSNESYYKDRIAFNVKGGMKYHVFAVGGTLGFCGFIYQPGAETEVISPAGKRKLTLDKLYYTLPSEDVLYDGEVHGAVIHSDSKLGTIHIIYTDLQGNETEDTPVNPGVYTVSFDIEEGAYYSAARFDNVGTFTIYSLDPIDWQALMAAYQTAGQGEGWKYPWDFSAGVTGAKNLHGVTYEKGHVASVDLSANGLSGDFPFALFSLANLTKLDVSNNDLSGDIGLMMAAYKKLNPTMTVAVKELDMSNNKLSGNIGAFAYFCPNLTLLNAMGNCLEDVYPTISPSVTSLNLSQQTISRVVDLHLAHLTVGDVATKVPSILLYDHANQTFTPNINLLCTTPDNTWGMTMAYQNGQLAVPYVSEQNTYYGESGDTLNVAVLYNNGSREGSTFRFSLSFDEGDGNFDGKVNILDLQTTLNYMFEEYTNKPYNFTASNLWKDEVINVQDAVCFVNMLLDANTVSARQQNAARKIAAVTSGASASVIIENGYLKIRSTVPVSAFDILVSSNQQSEVVSALNDLGFTCTYKQSGNKLHLVGYSLSGSEIPTGETAICELISGIVSSAMLADRDANEISVYLNGSTITGVQSSMFNPSSQEVYRIPLGAKRAITIDTTGRKTMTKDEK